MKVIEEGTGWQYRCTGNGNSGRGCNALLAVEHEDLRYFKGGSSDYSAEPAMCFRCPKCGTVTDIKRTDWAQTHTVKPYSTHWRDTGNDPVGD